MGNFSWGFWVMYIAFPISLLASVYFIFFKEKS